MRITFLNLCQLFTEWTLKTLENWEGKNQSVMWPCDLGGFHQATKRRLRQISYQFWPTMMWFKVSDHVQLHSSLLFFISCIIASVAFASNTLQSPSGTRFFKVAELRSVLLCVPETKLAGETEQAVDCSASEEIWSNAIYFESIFCLVFIKIGECKETSSGQEHFGNMNFP